MEETFRDLWNHTGLKRPQELRSIIKVVIQLAVQLANVQEKNITQYVSDNIWGPIHAENNAEWGLGAVDGLERSFAPSMLQREISQGLASFC